MWYNQYGDFKMNVIICLDDNNGMLFNNRRQSRDKMVLCDIFRDLRGETLYITPFSENLMADYSDRISVCDDVSEIDAGQWFFCENVDLMPFVDRIEKIIVYNWNRVYPADFSCSLDFSAYTLVGEFEFECNSHKVITKKVFVKE